MRKRNLMLLLLLGAVAALACGQFVPDLMAPWDGDDEIGGVTLRQQQPRSTPTTPQSGVLAIDTLDKVVVYTPHFSRIDLVCATAPSEDDPEIILAAEAAFTGTVYEGENFSHQNISGDHVSGGTYYQGHACADITGAFVWEKEGWRFVQHDAKVSMAGAADHQGAAFSQVLFIHRGERVHCNIAATQVFRALCKRHGQLSVVESRGKMRFFDFVLYLLAHDVDEALYLDSGKAFAHDNTGSLLRLATNCRSHATNWLVFYR